MEDFVLASTPVLYPSKQIRDLLCATSQPSDSIVIIEKERKSAPLLAKQLKLAGLDSCKISQWRAESHSPLPPMLVLVFQDHNVPIKVIWERCRKIRQYTDVPISILLSGVEPSEHVANVSMAGAPFANTSSDHMTEMSYISNPRHTVSKQGSHSHVLRRHGLLLLDSTQHQVTVKGQTLSLTPSEYKILEFLMTWPGRIFCRDELVDVLYGEQNAVVPRVVDVHISNLRKKIEPDLSCPTYIESVRGLGYRLTLSGDGFQRKK